MMASNRTEEQKALSQDMESFMDSIMHRYYMPWSGNRMESPYQREAWAKGFAAFLCKMGNHICRDAVPDHEGRIKLEDKLRSTLEPQKLEDLPARVVDLKSPAASSQANVRQLETLQAAKQGGTIAEVPLKRLAEEAGIMMSDAVVLKK